MRRRRLLLCAATVAAGCRGEIDLDIPARPSTRAAVETSEAGWVRVSPGDLVGAGLDPAAPLESLGLSRAGQPVAYAVDVPGASTLEEAGALSFWAEAPASRWTSTAVTWFTDGAAPDAVLHAGVRVPLAQADSSTPLRSSGRRADEKFYVLSLLNGAASNYIWDGAVAISGSASKSFEIETTAPLGGGDFVLTLELHGLSEDAVIDPDHHAVIEVNGHVAGELFFDGLGDRIESVGGPASWLVAGANTVTLRLPHDTGAPRDTVLVRALTLDQPRPLSADPAEVTVFAAGAPGAFSIEGPPPSSAIWDLADPRNPVRLGSPALLPPPPDEEEFPDDPEPARLRVIADAAATGSLVIVPPGAAGIPATVRAPLVQDLPLDGVELLIVTPADLAPAAERLATHRENGGTTARVFLWEEVVDHFGDGDPSPDALRTLAASAYALGSARWLLILGDASHDPKELLSPGGEPSGHHIPSQFEDAADLMESPSDNAAVADGPRELPWLAVGRIPAATLDEADAAVDKILAYEAAAATPATVVLAADDGPTIWEYDLFEQTNALATEIVGAPFVAQPIYVSTVGAAQARTDLLAALAAGPVWVNYLGHGNYTEWAAESIFTDDDVAALPEGDVLPVYTVMNCLTGHFTQPNWKLRSLGEQLVLAPGKGAIAVIASTALAYPGGQRELDLALMQRLLADTDAPTLGEALMQAKQQLDPLDPEQSDVIMTWHLLGDPSLRLKRP